MATQTSKELHKEQGGALKLPRPSLLAPPPGPRAGWRSLSRTEDQDRHGHFSPHLPPDLSPLSNQGFRMGSNFIILKLHKIEVV